MAVETTTVRRVVPSAVYPTITWSGVIAGAAVAIALDALLAILGGAIGASIFNPYALGPGQTHALTIGAGLWLVFSSLLAFLVGGFVGARTSPFSGYMNGMLQGLTVWAVALVVSVFLASIALPGGLGAAADASTPGGAPAAAIGQASAEQDVAAANVDKGAAETVAWWTFATVALGALGGIAGGRLGAEHLARRELALGA